MKNMVLLCINAYTVDSLEISPLSQRAKDERWSVYTFKNGLQTLPDSLLAKLTERGVTVRMGQPCTQLSFNNGKVEVMYNSCLKVVC